jgi:hypothetical protein
MSGSSRREILTAVGGGTCLVAALGYAYENSQQESEEHVDSYEIHLSPKIEGIPNPITNSRSIQKEGPDLSSLEMHTEQQFEQELEAVNIHDNKVVAYYDGTASHNRFYEDEIQDENAHVSNPHSSPAYKSGDRLTLPVNNGIAVNSLNQPSRLEEELDWPELGRPIETHRAGDTMVTRYRNGALRNTKGEASTHLTNSETQSLSASKDGSYAILDQNLDIHTDEIGIDLRYETGLNGSGDIARARDTILVGGDLDGDNENLHALEPQGEWTDFESTPYSHPKIESMAADQDHVACILKEDDAVCVYETGDLDAETMPDPDRLEPEEPRNVYVAPENLYVETDDQILQYELRDSAKERKHSIDKQGDLTQLSPRAAVTSGTQSQVFTDFGDNEIGFRSESVSIEEQGSTLMATASQDRIELDIRGHEQDIKAVMRSTPDQNQLGQNLVAETTIHAPNTHTLEPRKQLAEDINEDIKNDTIL